jgi:hypothetical protein
VEGGMLWRADVMERSCAVARGKDINSVDATGHGTRTMYIVVELRTAALPHCNFINVLMLMIDTNK